MRCAIQFAIALQALGLAAALPSDNATRLSYDYVIVGGGVLGLIVANRLTESKNETVLVIEAGRADDNPNIRMPYGATYTFNQSLLWQNHVSDPELALGNLTWNTRIAQVPGGGSVVNGMVYDRGSTADYDAWEALGNKSWGWEGMFPFFKNGTKFVEPSQKTVDAYGMTCSYRCGCWS